MIHRIAITPGEPAGIGPDLVIQLAQQSLDAELVAIVDPELMQQRAAALNLPLRIESFDIQQPRSVHQPGKLKILPVSLPHKVKPGHLDAANAAYVLDTLRKATRGCLDSHFDALVTGPVHKGVINDAGIRFSGHTEFLADLTRTRQVVMMLVTEGLRVALTTTHLPLREVCNAITPKLLEEVIRILHKDLRQKFAISRPRIYVCGLNPHAGEGGHLGHEDETIIIPVLEKLRSEAIDLIGPLPADTLFIPKYLDHADAVLAMYHDQGLPVLKHKGFGRAVNITLGLPFIRTSVDHGTALELAGSGKADYSSLQAAIECAILMSNNWQRAT